jgi:hypothetical protein
VIKTALMLERGFVLPNYDFKKPNEKIPFAKWNLKVSKNRLICKLVRYLTYDRCQLRNDRGQDRNDLRVSTTSGKSKSLEVGVS